MFQTRIQPQLSFKWHSIPVLAGLLGVWECQALICTHQYRIEYSDGSPAICQPCPDCIFGSGPLVPCGTTLQHPAKIECKDCIPGKTYSDEHGISSCKLCHICATGILQNCTKETNTVCRRKCDPEYYYENQTHNCQPCSYCCDDDNASNIRIPECHKQGLPWRKQCSAIHVPECTPPPPSSTPPRVSTSPKNTNASTPSIGSTDSSSILGVVGIIVGAIVGGLLIIALFCWCTWKHRRKRDRERVVGLGRDTEMQNMLPPQGKCGLQIIEPEDLVVQRTVSEGELTSFQCEVKRHSNNCHPKYQWQKDDQQLNGETSLELILDHVKMHDFGLYQCVVTCSCGSNCTLKTTKQELTVTPGPGKRYKRFDEIGVRKEDFVINWLAKEIRGVGNWKRVGEHFGMDMNLHDHGRGEDGSKDVIIFLKANHPGLTVYELCKFLKSIGQMVIVNHLKDDFTATTVQRDSGISDRYSDGSPPQFYSFQQPNYVNLPPASAPPESVAPPDSVFSNSQLSINDAVDAVHDGFSGLPQSGAVHDGYSGLPQSGAVHDGYSGLPQSGAVQDGYSGLPQSGAVHDGYSGLPRSDPLLESCSERPPREVHFGLESKAYTDSPVQSDDEHPAELLSTAERKKAYGRQSSSGSNKSQEGDSSSDRPHRQRSRSSSLSSVLGAVKDNVVNSLPRKLSKQNSKEKYGECLVPLTISTDSSEDEANC